MCKLVNVQMCKLGDVQIDELPNLIGNKLLRLLVDKT